MLGPFRISNLRRHPSQRISSQGPLSNVRREINEGAIVCVEGETYDQTIKQYPEARLKYLDPDDGEIVTVGSKSELAERLSEPFEPSHVTFKTSKTDGVIKHAFPDMHMFEINRADASIKVWENIEQQTRALVEAGNARHEKMMNVSPREECSSPTKLDKGKEAVRPMQNFMEKRWENRKALAFESSGPPRINSPNTLSEPELPSPGRMRLSCVLNGEVLNSEVKINPKSAVKDKAEVLTTEGKRQAKEAGEKLRSRRMIFQPSLDNTTMTSPSAQKDNRWASYSNAVETSATKVKTPAAGNTEALKVLPEKPGPALSRSFYENFEAQLAKLGSLEKSLEASASAFGPLEEAVKSHGEKHPMTDQGPVPTRSETSAPERSPPSGLLGPKQIHERYYERSQQELLSELRRRGLVPVSPYTPKSILISKLEEDDLYDMPQTSVRPRGIQQPEAVPRKDEGSDARFESCSDPVEVTVYKLMLQMLCSMASNMSTFNSQIQNQALPSLPEEALKLKGYPESAHSDDMWKDFATIKKLFHDFDNTVKRGTETIGRTYEHDTFPKGSGTIKLGTLDDAHKILAAYSCAIGQLSQGLKKLCIPISHEGPRAGYYIPKRLATIGYEDTWSVEFVPVPRELSSSGLKAFVEEPLAEKGLQVDISECRTVTASRGRDKAGIFEVRGKENAQNVLDVLTEKKRQGSISAATMQRKLYPSEFQVDKQPYMLPGYVAPTSHDGSSTASSESPKSLIKDHFSYSNKLRAIQDRRAAWRKEYKARTQSVKFEEPREHIVGNDNKRKAGRELDRATATGPESSLAPQSQCTDTPSSLEANRPQKPHQTFGTVIPPLPDSKGIQKRYSMPAIAEPLGVRSRSRSPVSLSSRPLLNRSKSVTFKEGPPVSRPVFGALPTSPDPTDVRRDAYSMQPSAKVGSAHSPDDNAGKHLDTESINPNVTIPPVPPPKVLPRPAVLPYCDQDAGAQMDFKVERRLSTKPLRQAKSMSSILKPPYARKERPTQQEAPASIGGAAGFPTLEEFEGKYLPAQRFPPLPTMEPLVPERLNVAKPATAPASSHQSSVAPPGSWPEEPEWPEESSGSFVNRMMGRGPQSNAWPVAEIGPSFRSLSPHSSPLLPDRFCLTDTWHATGTKPSNAWRRPFCGTEPPRRSATTASGPSDVGPSAPRRPYSTNFDGMGRLDWDRFLAPRPSRSNVEHVVPPPSSRGVDGTEGFRLPSPIRLMIPDPARSTVPPPAALHRTPAENPMPLVSPPLAPLNRAQTEPHDHPAPVAFNFQRAAARENGLTITHEDPATVRKVQECVERLRELGFGSKSGGTERLIVYAQSAEGDLEEAIDMILEERSAWGLD